MKNLLFFLSVFVVLNGFSQNFGKTHVNGEIIVESADISGITVYNKTLGIGTITNEKGKFTIDVQLNDIIEVSAVQYKNLIFSVNNDILQSKSMKILLIEEINELDEVIVFSKGLSGNLNADIEEKKRFKPKLDVLYFGIKNKDEFEFETDHLSKVESIAMDAQRLPAMVNGLNIINVVDQLLLPLFRSEVRDKKKQGVPEVPVQSIKYYFGSEFLIDNFDIPRHRVEEFIRYIEGDNFDYNLLNYGKEMEFLQVLSEQSSVFLGK